MSTSGLLILVGIVACVLLLFYWESFSVAANVRKLASGYAESEQKAIQRLGGLKEAQRLLLCSIKPDIRSKDIGRYYEHHNTVKALRKLGVSVEEIMDRKITALQEEYSRQPDHILSRRVWQRGNVSMYFDSAEPNTAKDRIEMAIMRYERRKKTLRYVRLGFFISGGSIHIKELLQEKMHDLDRLKELEETDRRQNIRSQDEFERDSFGKPIPLPISNLATYKETSLSNWILRSDEYKKIEEFLLADLDFDIVLTGNANCPIKIFKIKDLDGFSRD